MVMPIVMVMVIKRAVYIVCIINYDQIPLMVYGQVLAGHLPAGHLLARRKLATDICLPGTCSQDVSSRRAFACRTLARKT